LRLCKVAIGDIGERLSKDDRDMLEEEVGKIREGVIGGPYRRVLEGLESPRTWRWSVWICDVKGSV
jgi:hypothetical protein